MNVQPITISEFRKNTKVILDQAMNKKSKIFISRGWEVYELRFVGDATLATKPELKEQLDTMPVNEPIVVKDSQEWSVI